MKNLINGKKWFKKSDFILILVLLILAAVVFTAYNLMHRSDGEARCQIYYEGTLVQTLDLSEAHIFRLDQNPNVRFEIKDNSIAFIESDCPDKVCVHSGYLSRPGQMAACLPNRISIQIIPVGGYNEVDVYTS